MVLLAAVIVALAVGAIVAWLAAARRWEGKVREAEVRMEERERSFSEQKALLESSERKLADTFKSLAADALEAANHSFLTLADQKLGSVVGPVNESLGKLDREIREIEGARRQAYGALGEQISSLITAQKELRSEASNLSRALRAPSVRGRWGEIQLKRVVEMAGMLERCDFFQQDSAANDDGKLRPDLRVQLPGGKNIIVDAKVPLQAYLEALEAPTEDARQERLKQHAQQVRAHMVALGSKNVLGSVSAHARVRDPVFARRAVLQRRPGAGSVADRAGRGPARDSRHADDPDFAAARGVLRMAPGAVGGKRATHQRDGAGTRGPVRHDGRASAARRNFVEVVGERVQRCGGIVRGARDAVGAPLPRAWRGRQERIGRARENRRRAARTGLRPGGAARGGRAEVARRARRLRLLHVGGRGRFELAALVGLRRSTPRPRAARARGSCRSRGGGPRARRSGRLRERGIEAAQPLVFAAGARLEARDSVGDAMLDRRVVADVEVQVLQVFEHPQ